MPKLTLPSYIKNQPPGSNVPNPSIHATSSNINPNPKRSPIRMLLFILAIVILGVVAGYYFFFVMNDDSGDNNENSNLVDATINSNNNINTNSNPNLNSNIGLVNDNLQTLSNSTAGIDIDSWKTYNSIAGFSFKYPKNFIQDESLDALWELNSPLDNTDDVSFIMPQDCYDKTVEFFNLNMNINDNVTELDYFGDQCVSIDVSKESISYYEESDLLLNTNTVNVEGEEYQFAEISGTLISSVEKIEGVDYYDYELTGELGDYIFKINIHGWGSSQTELLSILSGVAESMEIDDEFLVEIDPYADTDGDGLLDEYELYHGTDPGLVDTDGDGYNDREETSKCYNPLGDGLMTGEHFYKFCVASISASPLVTTSTFDNREALCMAWKPIAEDFINGDLVEILRYNELQTDYPEVCVRINSLIGADSCFNVWNYLLKMCPDKL